MSRHWEKKIQQARATVASVGVTPERGDNEPMSQQEVESFVKGFGLSAAATARIVDEWLADQGRARNAGWDDATESYME